MKVLVLNGSPRPNGDTAYVLEALKNRFPHGTEFESLNAYEVNIQSCNDCRCHPAFYLSQKKHII